MKKEDIKALFTVEVENLISEEVKEVQKKEGEDDVTILKKVETNKPIFVYFKKPNRRLLEECEEYYSIKMSEYIKKGIITKAILAKNYRSSGGVLTEEEGEDHQDSYRKLIEKKAELIEASSLKRKNKKKESALIKEITQLERDIQDIEKPYQELFSNTAESKAQTDSIKFLLLNSSFYKSEKTPDEKPLFEGDSFKEKEDSYYDCFEYSDDECPKQFFALSNLSTAVALWYITRTDDLEEAFEAFISSEN